MASPLPGHFLFLPLQNDQVYVRISPVCCWLLVYVCLVWWWSLYVTNSTAMGTVFVSSFYVLQL